MHPWLTATFLSVALASAPSAWAQDFEFKRLVKDLRVTGDDSSLPADPGSAISFSTQAINFGSVATHTTQTRQVAVSNTGAQGLAFNALPVVSGDASFAAGASNCSGTLAIGDSCLAEVTFTPTTVGVHSGTLTFTTALANSPHQITLAGTAFNPVSLAASTLPEASVGEAYTFDFKNLLVVSNESSPNKSLATWTGSGVLPAGLTFNTTSGVLSGTPSAANAGSSYTVTTTYKDNSGQQVYTIVVNGAVLRVTHISAGNTHTCAITQAGAAVCWGSNWYGELGDGNPGGVSPLPVPVSGLTSGVVSISAGLEHSCAATASGQAYCWGSNWAGHLGDGSGQSSSVPVAVLNIPDPVVEISAGTEHTCARTNVGGAYCWGRNAGGRVGDGTTTTRLTPVPVSNMASGVTRIAAGYEYTCAIQSGALYCWGRNGAGQLGNGDTAFQRTPALVQGMGSGVTNFGVGSGHTCAVRSGQAYCWGSNNAGQLGNGTTTASLTAQPVAGLTSGVSAISVGVEHSCALMTAGTVQCWGFNEFGQLADGTYNSRTTAALVPSISGVTQLSSGVEHVCVIGTGEVAKCWGYNPVGQVSANGTLLQNTPINVQPF